MRLKKLSLLFIPSFLIVFIGILFLFSRKTSALEFPTDKLSVPIPTLELSTPKESGGLITNTWISDYLIGFYRFSLYFVGIVGVLFLIAGGILYTTSGGDSGKIDSAKEMIFGAAMGIIIMFGSYLVLSTVNPDLVKFPGLSISKVKAIPKSSKEKYPGTEGCCLISQFLYSKTGISYYAHSCYAPSEETICNNLANGKGKEPFVKYTYQPIRPKGDNTPEFTCENASTLEKKAYLEQAKVINKDSQLRCMSTID
ncbi:MAG: hypothetical protein HY453_00450 [Parcubacteria group bacterium]|nr:hypothetical protein [Parcubacteria group bacterium]